MPSRYTDAQKQEALRLLAVHQNNVPIVQNLTGISLPTLYRWRRHEFSQNPDLMTQKNIPSIDNHSHKTESPSPPDHPGAEIIRDGDQTYYRLPDGRVVNKLPAELSERPLQESVDDYATFEQPEELPDPDSDAAYWHKDNLLMQVGGGVPGKSYPYPLEEDEEESENDFEDFRKVRDMLMNHAHRLAANLRPDDPDINRRSLALSRVLDQIYQLDEMLPDLNPEKVIRFEYTYNGSVYNVPPWSDDELKYMNRIIDLEKELAEALNALEAAQSPQPSPDDAQ